MDPALLDSLRRAYNYIFLPRETARLRHLHAQISGIDQDEPLLFLEGDEICLIERALIVCQALHDLEEQCNLPLQITDGSGHSSPLLLTKAEIDEILPEADGQDWPHDDFPP